MRDHACLPDVISWSETGGAAAIEAHVAEYRGLAQDLGLGERPISISEYMPRDTVGAPGPTVAHLAALERARVGYACLALWHEPGTMGRLTAGNAPLAGFWIYRWYAAMSGRIVSAGPASREPAGADALASVDEESRTAAILVAGDRPHLVVYGFGATPFLLRDGRVHVRIERAPHNGLNPLPAPVLVSESDISASEHTLEIDVPTEGWDAARVVLSAPSARGPTHRRHRP
jgi:hypothetical protein